MMKTNQFYLLIFFLVVHIDQLRSQPFYKEMYRPQVHFSPKAHWMNDPNGLVFYKGIYHMFFQYYAGASIWGPNSWGHATSRDLIHWNELSPALVPDSLGLIASGSAVVDNKNTSGFGKSGEIPIVAIYAYINQEMEKKNINSQYQAIAYSLDETKSWTKYEHNPVIKNPGIRDFRDPKVIWYTKENKWIMTVATQDHVTYYSSYNLKDWKMESGFGKTSGAHTGVWECPDLIYFDVNGKRVWVQIVSINPGGPNGGSATQYFVGDFDGTTFKPYDSSTKWVDYGTDDYAGVTWSNTGSRRIFLGWMSNWQYANIVPTEVWRSAMTIPRELELLKTGDVYFLSSEPIKELEIIREKPLVFMNINTNKAFDLSAKLKTHSNLYELKLTTDQLNDFSVVLSNDRGEQLIVGYNKSANEYYIDRTKSGKTTFEKNFAKVIRGPRLATQQDMDLKLIVDATSVELFADNGLTVMTAIFFPNVSFANISLKSPGLFKINKLEYAGLKGIWNHELK